MNKDDRDLRAATENSDVQTRSRLAARADLLAPLKLDTKALTGPARAAIVSLADEVVVLRSQVAELREKLAGAVELADRDTLCPVFNRRGFLRQLSREIALAARFGTPLSVVYFDLDGLKQVNDRFGHATGDGVLQRVASILVKNTRESNIIARLGGDEFAIAMPHASLGAATAKGEALARQIGRLQVRDAQWRDAPPLRLGASWGAALWLAGWNPEMLISKADVTMLSARKHRQGIATRF